MDDNLDWEYRNLAGAFFGCAVVFNNTMFYFGGVGADSTQVSDSFNLKMVKHLNETFLTRKIASKRLFSLQPYLFLVQYS